ncbi:EI24 domain-containing protein [Candidatus Riflebacteria bacterium]
MPEITTKIPIYRQFILGLTFPIDAVRFLLTNPHFIGELKWCFLANILLFPLFFLFCIYLGNLSFNFFFPGLPDNSLIYLILKILLNLLLAGILILNSLHLFGLFGILVAFPFLHRPCRVLLETGLQQQGSSRKIQHELVKVTILTPFVLVLLLLSIFLKFLPFIGWFLNWLLLPFFGIIAGYCFIDFPLSLAGKELKFHLSFILDNFIFILVYGSLLYVCFLIPILGFFVQPLAVVSAARYFLLTEGIHLEQIPQKSEEAKYTQLHG